MWKLILLIIFLSVLTVQVCSSSSSEGDNHPELAEGQFLWFQELWDAVGWTVGEEDDDNESFVSRAWSTAVAALIPSSGQEWIFPWQLIPEDSWFTEFVTAAPGKLTSQLLGQL